MYKGKIVLKNLTEEELKDFLVSIGEKKFRGSQIYSWLYRNIRDFDEMNNIPKSPRGTRNNRKYRKGPTFRFQN